MTSNLALDPSLLVRVVAVSGESTKKAAVIIERFGALPLIQLDRQDHVAAAEVRNACRRGGAD